MGIFIKVFLPYPRIELILQKRSGMSIPLDTILYSNQQLIMRILLFLLTFVTLGLSAQERKVQHKPFIDERRFHYGFFFGIHDQGIEFENNGYIDPATGAQWSVENDKMNLGFSVGVMGDWRINRYISLRLQPSLHFGSKHLSFYDHNSGKRESQDMKSALISVPVLAKLSGPRFNNYRPYVMGGISASYDLTAKKHTFLRTTPLSFCLEAGFGCDFYLPFFKMIPELKFSFGLNDILEKDRNDLLDSSQKVFTESVNKANMNMVTLTLYFE